MNKPMSVHMLSISLYADNLFLGAQSADEAYNISHDTFDFVGKWD